MDETELLRQELEHYKKEKERVRRIIGQIGGQKSGRRDTVINVVFLSIVIGLFLFDVVREILAIQIEFVPRMLSLEIAVLLVSLKIIWMIHKQTKVDHFQFWMLNSIEYQINAVSKRIRDLETRIGAPDSG